MLLVRVEMELLSSVNDFLGVEYIPRWRRRKSVHHIRFERGIYRHSRREAGRGAAG